MLLRVPYLMNPMFILFCPTDIQRRKIYSSYFLKKEEEEEEEERKTTTKTRGHLPTVFFFFFSPKLGTAVDCSKQYTLMSV